jgi:hypothetical protein
LPSKMIEVKQLRHMMCADVRCKGWVGCRDLCLNDTVSFLPLGPQDFSHSSALLSAAAERVWEVFIQNKREVCWSILVLLHLGHSLSYYRRKPRNLWCLVESKWKHSSHMRLRWNYNETTVYCRNQTSVTEMKETFTYFSSFPRW